MRDCAASQPDVEGVALVHGDLPRQRKLPWTVSFATDRADVRSVRLEHLDVRRQVVRDKNPVSAVPGDVHDAAERRVALLHRPDRKDFIESQRPSVRSFGALDPLDFLTGRGGCPPRQGDCRCQQGGRERGRRCHGEIDYRRAVSGARSRAVRPVPRPRRRFCAAGVGRRRRPER